MRIYIASVFRGMKRHLHIKVGLVAVNVGDDAMSFLRDSEEAHDWEHAAIQLVLCAIFACKGRHVLSWGLPTSSHQRSQQVQGSAWLVMVMSQTMVAVRTWV